MKYTSREIRYQLPQGWGGHCYSNIQLRQAYILHDEVLLKSQQNETLPNSNCYKFCNSL